MKTHSKVGYLLPYLLPLILLGDYYLWNLANWSLVIFVFILIPLIDAMVGVEKSNVDHEEEKKIEDEAYFSWVLYSWALIIPFLLIWTLWQLSTQPLLLHAKIGLILSVSLVVGGVGITVAHELGHKKSAWDRKVSQWILLWSIYMHFYIEHNRGHHVHVGTPKDPATSRKNEHFYAFWPRTVFGSWLNAWKLEFNRMKKNKKHLLHWDNKMLQYSLIQTSLFIGLPLILSFGVGANFLASIGLLALIAVLSFTLLELVNYIEHYGLSRKELSMGQYERVDHMHSWNSSHAISNYFLFQLQRHSDHHAYSARKYQILRHFEESPQLPAGYPTMILLALVPPLWFAIMNPKLDDWAQSRKAA